MGQWTSQLNTPCNMPVCSCHALQVMVLMVAMHAIGGVHFNSNSNCLGSAPCMMQLLMQMKALSKGCGVPSHQPKCQAVLFAIC